MTAFVRYLLLTTLMVEMTVPASAQQLVPGVKADYAQPELPIEQDIQLPSSDRTYNTIGGAENGGDSFQTGGPVLANAILSGQLRGFLYAIRLRVRLKVRDLGSFDIFVSNIAADGSFYSTRVIATISDKLLSRNFGRLQMDFGSTVGLAANTKYYVGIRQHVGAKCTVILGNTVDPRVTSRREVKESGFFYNKRGEQPNSDGPYEMSVFIR